jgi:hypothetical protein
MSAKIRFEDMAREKSHLVGDAASYTELVRLASERARLAGLISVPPPILTGDVVSLERYQTPFKIQGTRGTCYAFAACAAIEAAYKRKYGVELDLSEQYAFHLNKAGELYPDYLTNPSPHENNSSYWGFQGSSDVIDKLARAAIPDEAAAPYLDEAAMDQLRTNIPESGSLDIGTATQEQLDAFEFSAGLIPTQARQQARYRVTQFGALPGMPTPEQVEAVLRGGHEVVADVPGHCLLIVGFDRPRRTYSVKNSWGEGRFIELSYDSTSWPILGGRFVIDVDTVDAQPQLDAYWPGRWHMDHDGWRGDLSIRRTTDYRRSPGDLTKLGNYYRDGQRYDVNGATSEDGQALHFWIANTPGKVQPGAQQGQEFWAHVYSQDCTRAAGSTLWGGSGFGVRLGRDELHGRPSTGFDAQAWVGDWAMNHDGWLGALTIASVEPFIAVYTASWGGGGRLPVSGGPAGNTSHFLQIGVPFFPGNPQDFRLFGHTRENDVFSGITLWGGRTYGVQGRRAPVNDEGPPGGIRGEVRWSRSYFDAAGLAVDQLAGTLNVVVNRVELVPQPPPFAPADRLVPVQSASLVSLRQEGGDVVAGYEAGGLGAGVPLRISVEVGPAFHGPGTPRVSQTGGASTVLITPSAPWVDGINFRVTFFVLS